MKELPPNTSSTFLSCLDKVTHCTAILRTAAPSPLTVVPGSTTSKLPGHPIIIHKNHTPLRPKTHPTHQLRAVANLDKGCRHSTSAISTSLARCWEGSLRCLDWSRFLPRISFTCRKLVCFCVPLLHSLHSVMLFLFRQPCFNFYFFLFQL